MKSTKWIVAVFWASLVFFSPLSLSAEPLKVAAAATAENRVDVNHADAETLARQLKGVGLKKAQAIVDYRTANGPFKKMDDLLNVKGIGKSILAKNKGRILL